ncbi:DM13 domain-containing protein [Formosa haliotis]|uniref:DM13 domain-containing protein n=1 Tax=Formosa haliotis TaxID=1555194 RepID=UPI0008262C14|nr:DM13 domain-containing protein [Formosa haliotis]
MKLKLFPFFILVLCLSFSSCSSSDDDSSNTDETEQPDDTPFAKGDFVSVAHPTTGTATVNHDKSELQLTSFKTDSGPLLELYLTTALDAEDFISLGVLKGINGDYTYSIPENTDLSKYKYVIVWCVDFSVNFGYAILE